MRSPHPLSPNGDGANKRTLDQALDALRQRVQERAAHADKAPSNVARPSVQLPLWDELDRAIPNHIARSSLFAPVARGRRKMHDGTTLSSRSDVMLRYWGKQLDEPDCDVWMQALHEARLAPLGQPIPVRRASFLRSIGRHTGKYEYDWLHESLLRLSLGMLEVKAKKYAVGDVPKGEAPSKKIHRVMHLIDGFDYDEELEEYVLHVDPRMVKLFGNREFALVDWDKRLKIKRGQDMAKALQRLVATSADATQRYSLDWLKEKLQYGGRYRDFKDAVSAAITELERVEVIAGGRIEAAKRGNEQTVWTRL